MEQRSNGSHSPFRPTRLSPAGYDPYADYDGPESLDANKVLPCRNLPEPSRYEWTPLDRFV